MQPPQTQVIIPQWLALPMPVRLHLKKVFGIPRSEGSNMVDGRVISDGHTHPDLARITPEAMEAYLGLERVEGHIPVFHELFAMTLEKAESELAPAPTNAEAGKHIDAPKPLMLSVGGKTYMAVEVIGGNAATITAYDEPAPAAENAPLYPAAPAAPVVKKTRAPRTKKAK